MEIKCKSCNYEWDYKGKSNFFICCPRCLNKQKSPYWNKEKKVKNDKNN